MCGNRTVSRIALRRSAGCAKECRAAKMGRTAVAPRRPRLAASVLLIPVDFLPGSRRPPRRLVPLSVARVRPRQSRCLPLPLSLAPRDLRARARAEIHAAAARGRAGPGSARNPLLLAPADVAGAACASLAIRTGCFLPVSRRQAGLGRTRPARPSLSTSPSFASSRVLAACSDACSPGSESRFPALPRPGIVASLPSLFILVYASWFMHPTRYMVRSILV
ncbi:hypothetical protein B0H15DRAFT_947845 [Mycena belliarum]|uniref:Uncharacterized protein n=1 Tax=Mycena belliarum TaxID=1033014 RepID=A0AAD6XQL2_9AGAR|nr:hypothetical protein B0H15DRAFT_947845 [Mycena belliae]